MLGGGRDRWTWGLLALAIFAAIPLVYAWSTGAASIPHNDDWAFTRVLFHLSRTGDLKLVGWNEMILLGHLFWAYPLVRLFGEHIVILDTAVGLISVSGVVGTAILARRFLPAPFALATGALLAVFPGYIQTSVSYMTDPVAFLAQIACFLVGLAGIERDDDRGPTLIGISMLIGLFAFSIRKFALITPVAVGIGAAAAGWRRGRIPTETIVAVALFLLGAGTIYYFRQAIPNGGSHAFGTPGLRQLIVLTAQSVFTLGLAASPVLLFVARRRPDLLGRYLNLGALLGVGLVAVTLHHSSEITTCCLGGRSSVFVGNALTERGMMGNQGALGDRPTLFPYAYWIALTALGSVGGVIGLGWLWSGARKWLRDGSDVEPGLLALISWGILTGVAIVSRAALGGPLFDRYLTVPLVVAAIVALRAVKDEGASKIPRSAGAVFLLLAFTSLLLMTSGLSFDVARWRAGEAAVRAGTPATSVDAGFEWVGFHYDGVAEEDIPPISFRMGPGYFDAFPAAANCIVVATSPQDNPELAFWRTVPYRTWFGFRELELWVYRHGSACPNVGET